MTESLEKICFCSIVSERFSSGLCTKGSHGNNTAASPLDCIAFVSEEGGSEDEVVVARSERKGEE